MTIYDQENKCLDTIECIKNKVKGKSRGGENKLT